MKTSLCPSCGINKWSAAQTKDGLCFECGGKHIKKPNDLARAVNLVLDAGLSTGHAETCFDLVGELLDQMAEIRNENERLSKAIVTHRQTLTKLTGEDSKTLELQGGADARLWAVLK